MSIRMVIAADSPEELEEALAIVAAGGVHPAVISQSVPNTAEATSGAVINLPVRRNGRAS